MAHEMFGSLEGLEEIFEKKPFKIGSYTPVIKHSNGKSPFSIGNTSSKGSFSIAMLDYQRVCAPKYSPTTELGVENGSSN